MASSFNLGSLSLWGRSDFLRRGLMLVVFLSFLGMNCGTDNPVVISQGEHKCEHCYMKIVDMRFDSQAITDKGKRYHFDSIECMGYWTIRNNPQVKHFWVKDFNNSKSYLKIQDSYFLKSEKRPSPMGAYLSAYNSVETIDSAKSELGGDNLDWEGVVEYLKERRK